MAARVRSAIINIRGIGGRARAGTKFSPHYSYNCPLALGGPGDDVLIVLRRLIGSLAALAWVTVAAARQGDLHLKTGDVVRIVVTAQISGDPYTGDYLIQSDGAIYGIGFQRLVISSLNLADAQQALRQAMKRLVKPDEVFLTLKSEIARRVFIIGSPGGTPASGTVDIIAKLDLRQALAGIASYRDADLMEARVFRGGKQVALVSVEKLLNGSTSLAGFELAPNDVVSLSAVPTLRVWITGSVRNPGPQIVPVDASLDQAIAQAGGVVLPSTGDALATRAEYRVILRRGITKTEFPIWGGSSALAAAVEAGDTITVEPPARNRIVVMGEVRNPGEIIAKPGTSLLSAIAQAGGVTGEGNASQTLVYRGGEPILVDAELNVDPKRAVGFELQDGDTIVVRRNERVLYIFGEVQHQGRIAYPVGRTLHVTDALALAGGLGQNGTLRRVYLARPGADGHYRVTRFNLDEFIKDGRVAANPELEPGDVLLFGQPRQTVLAAITQVIGSLLFVEAISGAAGIRTTLP